MCCGNTNVHCTVLSCVVRIVLGECEIVQDAHAQCISRGDRNCAGTGSWCSFLSSEDSETGTGFGGNRGENSC